MTYFGSSIWEIRTRLKYVYDTMLGCRNKKYPARRREAQLLSGLISYVEARGEDQLDIMRRLDESCGKIRLEEFWSAYQF